MTGTPRLFKVLDCPNAPGAESIVVLLHAGTAAPFYYCEGCACAWERLPVGNTDPGKCGSITHVAPDGFVLPTRDDLHRCGIAVFDEVSPVFPEDFLNHEPEPPIGI